jgi:plastocyanin
MKKLLLICTSFAVVSITAFAAKVTVKVDNDTKKFIPENVEAHVGDTIEWIPNNSASIGSHTITSSEVPDGAATFDFDPFNSANSMFSYEVTQAGTYSYFCRPHRELNMVGTISVEVITDNLEAFMDNSQISLSPNPAKNNIHLKLDPAFSYDVKVMNSKGENVSEAVSAGLQEYTANIETLSSGLYFVHVSLQGQSAAEKKKVFKFVKE